MQDWQRRVSDELDALNVKLAKLRTYLTNNSADDLLVLQENIMTAYANVLKMRIKKF